MPGQDLERTVGGALELTCRVSGSSAQHTHLAVSWFLTTNKDAAILSLSRDFVLVPGESFSERFSSGDVRMDKLSDSVYRLSIRDLRPSDQGDLFCQGSEWIQDPDGMWTKITEKTSQKTTLKISAPRVGDFMVEVEIPGPSIRLRSPLEITCLVYAQGLVGGRFRVTWLLNGAIMATWDSSGISSFGANYTTRGAKRQMTVMRRNQETWTLQISQTREQDGGSYRCDVMEEGTGILRQSTPVSVTIETPGSPPPSVALRTDVSVIYEGDLLTLFCQVSGVSESVEVTWLFMGPRGRWVEVASLRRNGAVEAAGEYIQRHVTGHLTGQRLNNGLHSLTLHNMVEGDGGRYMCRLIVPTLQPDDEWRNATYDSDRIQVDVRPLGSGLEVVLISRDQRVSSGVSVSLFCRVSAGFGLQDKLLSWFWDFQSPSGPVRTLVNVSGDGGLFWDDSAPGFQMSIVGQTNILKIQRVQRLHQGAYRCGVTVQKRGSAPHSSAPHASATSIAMNVMVQLPAARLQVDASHRVVMVTGGQDEALVYCNITAVTPGAVHHIGWFWSAVNVLNVTHEGLTSHNPSFPWLLSERPSPHTSVLRILRPRLLGSFYCAVRELMAESGEWASLAERTSGVTRLTLSPSDKILKVAQDNVSRAVGVGGEVVLRCPLEEVGSSAAIYSVSWYHQEAALSHPGLLYGVSREGVTEYKEGRAERLHMVAAARGNYSLILRSLGPEDAGRYHCQVEEWRLQEDGWRLAALNTSGYLTLTVSPPEDRLSVNRSALTLVTPEGSGLSLGCQVLSTSGPGSVFSVSWWRVRTPGHRLLFNASHLGQMECPPEEEPRLQYQRTSEMTFQLRILQTKKEDAGTYYCRVQEWGRAPRGGWEQIGQQSGGNVSVTIRTPGVTPPICPPPWLLLFLLLVLVLLLLLLVGLGWKLLTRWRNKRRRSIRSGRGLWPSVKTSEMNIDQRGEGPKTEEAEPIQMQPITELSH